MAERERRQADRAPERAEHRLGATTHAIGGDGEEPAHQTTGVQQDENEADLLVGQSELAADRLHGSRRQECEPLVRQADDEQRGDEGRGRVGEDGQEPGLAPDQ
jgi:hypothetical protein